MKHSLDSHAPTLPLKKLRWHQYSVTRLAALATLTAFVGYVASATFSIQSIDQLLHLIHDDDVEKSIQHGMDDMRQSYSVRQELVIKRLHEESKSESSSTDSIKTLEQMRQLLHTTQAEELLGASIDVITETPTLDKISEWKSRMDLKHGRFEIQFKDSKHEDAYRKAEAVLQRYKVIGLELRKRIRPALIRSLSVTLAVTFLLMIGVFVIGTSSIRRRVRMIIDGIEKFAEGHEDFRLTATGHNEFGQISRQFNAMANEVIDNRKRSTNLEKLASWQTIARKMAHEIKNPLTPIQIMIGQLRRNYRGEDLKYKELVENAHKVILEEVSSLRRMVDDFSEFAQLPKANLRMADLTDTLSSVASLASNAYVPHTISLILPKEPLLIPHDKDLLRHAVHNLIKNAAEADPTSSSVITVSLHQYEENVSVQIHDLGPGIPIDLQESIFEAYVTTKHTGPSPGMGLGLAICQKVVLEHNGRLAVTSKPGNTIFTIEIPKYSRGISHE